MSHARHVVRRFRIAALEPDREGGNDLALAAAIRIEHWHAHGVDTRAIHDGLDDLPGIATLQHFGHAGLGEAAFRFFSQHDVREARDVLVRVALLLTSALRQLARNLGLRESDERLRHVLVGQANGERERHAAMGSTI